MNEAHVVPIRTMPVSPLEVDCENIPIPPHRNPGKHQHLTEHSVGGSGISRAARLEGSAKEPRLLCPVRKAIHKNFQNPTIRKVPGQRFVEPWVSAPSLHILRRKRIRCHWY